MDPSISASLMTRRQIRFVLVNERTPIAPSLCAMCCTPIGRGYVREFGTRVAYCSPPCYANHRQSALLAWPAREQPAAREAAHTGMV